MIFLYKVLTTLLYPLLILLIYFRKIIKKEDGLRFKEKIFTSYFNIKKKNNAKLIWFHAASIGEFKSILPIIEEINKKDKFEFLITTTTISSGNLAKEELKKFNNIIHRYFPLDVDFLMKKFLLSWKPKAIFLVDSEIWPNLIFNADKLNIPIGIINARITLKTFKRWVVFKKNAKKIFNLLSICLTSNSETKDYLLELGVNKVFYNGNIKLINKINQNEIENLNKNLLLNNRFWVAASTHIEEEDFCLQVHSQLKDKFKNILTIIAPRHIERVKHIKKMCDKSNLNAQVLNKYELIQKEKEIIIINSFGVLPSYFKYAKSVFIGKSTIKRLERVGGQNPIDAAQLGCKVYHGPYVYNFEEIYYILRENNITKKINNATELSKYLIKDLQDLGIRDNKIPKIINNLGEKTLTDTMRNINNFLFNEIK